MELKTFVAETIKQIVDGILIAQQDLKERKVDGIVNPPFVRPMAGGGWVTSRGAGEKTVQMVEFEVVLGQTEGLEAGGRIRVFFASAGAGAQGRSETGSTAVNKIKFSIPRHSDHGNNTSRC